MKYPREWEEIDTYSERLKVAGGWVIRCWLRQSDLFANSTALQMLFVPDPQHKWELEDESKI